jgi:hypothetical protein
MSNINVGIAAVEAGFASRYGSAKMIHLLAYLATLIKSETNTVEILVLTHSDPLLFFRKENICFYLSVVLLPTL